MAKRKTKAAPVAVPAEAVAPKQQGMFIDLTPIGQPSGYPVHGEWTTWETAKSGKSTPTVNSCGGLLMLPEEAGIRSPPLLPPEIERRYPVACAQCSARSGQVVRVDGTMYDRVHAASRTAGTFVGQMGEQTITLGHLGKPARSMLHAAFLGDTKRVKDGSAKVFGELYDRGLVTAANEITELGKRVAAAAGWGQRGAA